jgi:hypothetical protein
MDRANITTILSDTQQILQDLYLEFTFSDDYDFDIDGQPTFIPLNNDLLDYAAGWQNEFISSNKLMDQLPSS